MHQVQPINRGLIPSRRLAYLVLLHLMVLFMAGMIWDLREQLKEISPSEAPHKDFKAEREAMTEKMKAMAEKMKQVEPRND